ncbi:MAG: thiosulfate/3-mercaptopyruvate sulfurtransferase [Oleiphilaceae bacterium]|jgi:thiosulfate/3-mercaptopyruvate sulfurtransferase
MLEAENLLPLLIEPEELQRVLSNHQHSTILLIDLASEERFLQAHIPGARLILPSETQTGPPTPGFSPSDDQLTFLMQRIGLTKDSHIVVYDDEGGGWAGRFIWLLDEIGHTKYSYLNGGIHAWAAANFALEKAAVPNSPSNINVNNKATNSMSANDIIEALKSNSIQVWDARSPMEYTGEKINAAKGGHIPGALNYEWTNAMDQSRNLRLKPLEQIKKELETIGISADKDTVTHCQSHHRSGLTYLLGKLLNFKSIKAYPGSWGEWGNLPNTPIE